MYGLIWELNNNSVFTAEPELDHPSKEPPYDTESKRNLELVWFR